jgi:hypothetical protein
MKTGVLTVAYDECEWLDAAIRSVANEFDEIVILEGAYEVSIKAGASPRSTDGTLEIIETLKKEFPNVTCLHCNESDAWHQLNKGLEVLKDKGVEWFLLLDADEVWTNNHLKIIKKFMQKGEKAGIYQYWVYFYNFINSFDSYNDARMKRVFKLTPGCTFLHVNELAWPDHGKPVDSGVPAPHISEIPAFCRCFHYTEIKSPKRWFLKKRYLKNRDGNTNFDSWCLSGNGFERGQKGMKSFDKQHPEIVQQTKLYKLWEKDPELLKEELFGEFSLRAIYDKYRNRVISFGRVNFSKDQYNWYVRKFDDRHVLRRTSEVLIRTLEETKPFFEDTSKIKVLDMACGCPFVWEYLYYHYAINDFVGVDLYKEEVFDRLFQEERWCKYQYSGKGIANFLSNNKEKFDLIIAGNIVKESNLSALQKVAKPKCIIIYEYHRVFTRND